LDLKPESPVVLHKVLDLYTETEQWKKAIEILGRLASIERDPRRRGKFYCTAGFIYSGALKSTDEAIGPWARSTARACATSTLPSRPSRWSAA
jgi:lipopolysaccharide biosynthesis regulator YciM